METGKLFLIPSPLGTNAHADRLFPPGNIDVIRHLDYFIVENVRTARRFIASAGHRLPIDQLSFSEIGKHSSPEEYHAMMNPILNGKDAGLLSEAGTPCVADPGSEIVRLAQERNIQVVPLVGPSSILMALMGSGFNGQHFAFHGYLPVDRSDLSARLKQLETDAIRSEQTQIFIETPFRNQKLLDTVLKVCQPGTRLCIAVDLTLPSESIRTLSIGEWRKSRVDLHKRPAVFLLYK